MITRRIQNPLLVVVAAVAVVMLSFFLIIGANRVTAQTKNESVNADLGFSLERKGSQLEVVGRHESTVLGNGIGAGEDVPRHRSLAIGPIGGEEQGVGTDMDMTSRGADTNITYQGVYTDAVNYASRDVERKGSQLEAVDDLKSAVLGSGDGSTGIGEQSTNSGSEYVPSSAFRHDGYSPASGYRFWSTTGYIRNNSSGYMCLAAPVYLPNSATITQFSMYFKDDHATSDMWADLWRSKLASPPNGFAEQVAGLSFSNIDESTIFRGFTYNIEPGTQTVSKNYGYYIGFCFDPDTGLEQLVYGFRVDYTP